VPCSDLDGERDVRDTRRRDKRCDPQPALYLNTSSTGHNLPPSFGEGSLRVGERWRMFRERLQPVPPHNVPLSLIQRHMSSSRSDTRSVLKSVVARTSSNFGLDGLPPFLQRRCDAMVAVGEEKAFLGIEHDDRASVGKCPPPSACGRWTLELR
jgi:hypothetical protein